MENDFVFKLNQLPKINVENYSTLFILDKSENTPNIHETLGKIALALNLNVEKDICFYWTTKNTKTNLGPILDVVKHVVCFNVETDLFLPNVAQLEKYRVYTFESCNFQLADDMKTIISNLDKKAKLWACLQKQFLKK